MLAANAFEIKRLGECGHSQTTVLYCLKLMQRLEVLRPIRYHSGSQFQGLPVFVSGLPGQISPMRRLGQELATGFAIAVVLAVSCGAVSARNSSPANTIALSKLPPEAQTTHRLILAGGPFPFPKDGIVFGNREHALPRQARGFYREYTVVTPGASNRGARRIVCGGRQATQPEACFYSADHYASFSRISE